MYPLLKHCNTGLGKFVEYILWFQFTMPNPEEDDGVDWRLECLTEIPDSLHDDDESWLAYILNHCDGYDTLLDLHGSETQVEKGIYLYLNHYNFAKRHHIGLNQPFMVRCGYWSSRDYWGEWDEGNEYEIIYVTPTDWTQQAQWFLEWVKLYTEELELHRRALHEKQQATRRLRELQEQDVGRMGWSIIWNGSTPYDSWYTPMTVWAVLVTYRVSESLTECKNRYRRETLLQTERFDGDTPTSRDLARRNLFAQIRDKLPHVDLNKLPYVHLN